MKCFVCGSQINQGEVFCGNCGANVSSADLGNGNENPLNGNQFNPQNGYAQGVYVNNGKSQPSFKKGVLSLAFIILIAVLYYGGRYYYRNEMTKTFEGTGYTIELPASMNESFAKDVSVADSFMNGEVMLGVEIFKYEDLGGKESSTGLTADDFYSILQLYSTSTITFDSCDGEYIYYTENTYDKIWKGLFVVKETDIGYYFFEFSCEKENSSKYHPKFKEWGETVKFT